MPSPRSEPAASAPAAAAPLSGGGPFPLAAVTEGLSEGLLVLSRGLEVTYANRRVREFVGHTGSAIVGANLREVFDRVRGNLAEPDAIWQAWLGALRRAETFPQFDMAVIFPRRDVRVSVFPLRDSSEDRLAVGVLLADVTAARDLERTKDELLAVFGHELRTPLTAFVGFTELLLRRELSVEQQRAILDVMLKEGQRLSSLLKDFMDVQYLRDDADHLQLEPADPGRIVAGAVAAVADDPSRPVGVHLAADLPAVNADAASIEGVLRRLIDNARKYSPAGGPVSIEVTAPDREVRVAVRDRGIGLTPAALTRVFDRFYRVDTGDRRESTGIGLGLTVCRHVIALHGGRIWAESPGPGLGSTFLFTLPAGDR